MNVSVRKPNPEVPFVTVKADDTHKLLRKLELKELKKIRVRVKMLRPQKKKPKGIPKQVDYSPQMTFVRV